MGFKFQKTKLRKEQAINRPAYCYTSQCVDKTKLEAVQFKKLKAGK